MIDYGKLDENPLLEDLDKEFYNLEDQFKLFMSICETLDKEITKTPNIQDKEKIHKLIVRFQNVNEIMDNINFKTKFIQNYLNSDNLKEKQKNYFSKLKTITFSISAKFEELNGKFNNIVEDAKRRIDNQIGINTSMYLEQDGKNPNDENANNGQIANVHIMTYAGNTHANFDADKIVTERIKMDIDRLKERKEELLKIAKITKQILDFSREMKMSITRQSSSMSKIEDHLIDTKLQVKNGEEELVKAKNSVSSNNTCLFWLLALISILVIIGVTYLYLKLK